jgi:pimeloyl-ACP methyl ester carboxylesterase
MTTKLIYVDTQDSVRIHGLLYSESKKQRIVVLVHGACMNFLNGVSAFIPQMTSEYNRYDFLSVNMRAHDLGYIVNRYDQKEGWSWQTIDKNMLDFDAILTYLVDEDYEEIILCGHSWGGLVCLDYLKNSPQNPCSEIILISPTVSYRLLVEVNYRNSIEQTQKQANDMLTNGLGDFIIPTIQKSPLPFMSAKTIIEFLNNSFEAQFYLEKTTIRTNIIVGGLEHKGLQQFAMNLAEQNELIKSHIVMESNHFYSGHEKDLVELIDSILRR